MPELPEVETTRRGIAPFLEGFRIATVRVRNRRLRWPVPARIEHNLQGQIIDAVRRRGKYLLLQTGSGTALIHLGMSGSLRITQANEKLARHDHFDIELETGDVLRFNDPRRFGSFLWTPHNPEAHPLLAKLGPEPLEGDFSGAYLHRVSAGRRIAIKPLLMNAGIVVGVGNIYASESLFRAGVSPRRSAGRISQVRMDRLAIAVKAVLQESIDAGGTTLRDFLGGDGKPGYFRQQLQVYGRAAQPCVRCKTLIRQIVLAQRSTFYCTNCQR
jgi:formamidopyrimidine-DNA glycosylase